MKTITLKDIPPRVHTALKQRARQHGRSLNKEVLACLEMAVAPTRVDVHALLLDIRAHRRDLPGQLDDGLILAADAGRP